MDVSQLLIRLDGIPLDIIPNYTLATIGGGSIKQFGYGILHRVLFKQIQSDEYRALFLTLSVLFDVFFAFDNFVLAALLLFYF